jgi:hypothetical protein
VILAEISGVTELVRGLTTASAIPGNDIPDVQEIMENAYAHQRNATEVRLGHKPRTVPHLHASGGSGLGGLSPYANLSKANAYKAEKKLKAEQAKVKDLTIKVMGGLWKVWGDKCSMVCDNVLRLLVFC